jgi:hypothetical protein
MKRIGVIGAAMGIAAALSSAGMDVVTLADDRPVGGERRRVAPATHFTGWRSKYMPHQGAKERERAKRLYESRYLNDNFVTVSTLMGANLPASMCHERSTPTLCQMSKRQYAEVMEDRLAA